MTINLTSFKESLIYMKNTFVGVDMLSMWAVYMKNLPNFLCQCKQLILLLTLVCHCLSGYMNEVWRNKTYWQFSDLSISFIHLLSKDLKNMWKNHTQLQQPGMSYWFYSPVWVTRCSRTSPRSSVSICYTSASVVELLTLEWTVHPSWS